MNEPSQVATALLRAIDDGAWGVVAGLFAPGAEYRPPRAAAKRGRAAIETYYRHERAVVRGLHRIDQLWADADRVVVAGQFVAEAPDGQRLCARFVDCLRIEAGLIVDREVLTRPAGSSALPTLTSARLTLRAFRVEDAARVSAIAGEYSVADTTISVPHPLDAERARSWIVDDLAHCSAEQRIYAVEERADGRLIGSVGLRHLDSAHGQGELSFWFDAAARGRGYATEAGARLLDHAASSLRLSRVVAYFMVRNAASARVLDKLGFAREGVLRRRVVKWGRPEDVEAWARLL